MQTFSQHIVVHDFSQRVCYLGAGRDPPYLDTWSRCSSVSFAWRWLRSPWQLGGAVRLIKSYNDLQSAAIKELVGGGSLCNNFWTSSGGAALVWSPSRGGIAANAAGCRRVSSACCHFRSTLFNQPHYSLTQETMSTAPANDIASADNVLTATFWIFLECHTSGLTTLVRFSPINRWHDIITMPWWESGIFWEANEASEKAMNRNWLLGK